MKENENFEKEVYLQFWQNLLSEFFCWNPIEVQKWADQIPGHYCPETGRFHFKAPSHYVLHLMIPDKLVSTLTVDLFHIQDEIKKAIESCGTYSDPKFDFRMAKKNVIRLLNEYGEVLPIYKQIINPTEECNKKNKPYYLWIWWKVLNEVLGWDKEDVLSWSHQYDDGLNDIDAWFYHELPSYYVTLPFIPDELKNRLVGMQFHKLNHCIQQKIDGRIDIFNGVFDFVGLKGAIQEIIKREKEIRGL